MNYTLKYKHLILFGLLCLFMTNFIYNYIVCDIPIISLIRSYNINFDILIYQSYHIDTDNKMSYHIMSILKILWQTYQLSYQLQTPFAATLVEPYLHLMARISFLLLSLLSLISAIFVE